MQHINSAYASTIADIVKPLKLFVLCFIGVSLDIISSRIGWGLGFAEAGTAFFLAEFIALFALSLVFCKLRGFNLALIPVFFAFLPLINNLSVIGGII